jgi:hypothetical protein
MPQGDDEPRDSGRSPMDRFLRFGAALFAVKKNELPKREPRAPKQPRTKRGT